VLNIVSNFEQIMDFARKMQVPLEKKRGVLREYLQSKFIAYFYLFPDSNKMTFVGGTGLRLLRGLNRFSEDLDFDNLGLSNTQVKKLITDVVNRFQVEGFDIELRAQIKECKTYYDLRFPYLLKELRISTNPREKLMIKFDYSDLWKAQTPEVVLFNKYGFIENILVNTLNQMLVQKLTAYVQRKITQPRDIYDIVWLFSQGAVVDRGFAELNGVADVVQLARNKFTQEGISGGFKTKLAPYLFNPDDVRKLDLFGGVLNDLVGTKVRRGIKIHLLQK